MVTGLDGSRPAGASSSSPYDRQQWPSRHRGRAGRGSLVHRGGGNRIGRITTGGVITEFPLPTGAIQPGVLVGIGGITAGPDGALWFTRPGANKIGRISTTGAIAEFLIPTTSSLPDVIAAGPTSSSFPAGIAAGPDGALWFSEQSASKVARITTGGATEFLLPHGGDPSGITAGPDGALWFTEFGSSRIGRIAPSLPPLTATPTPIPPDFKLSLNGTTAYAEAPHAAELNLTGSWTVGAWFRDTNPAGYDHPRARILAKGDTAGPEVPYLLGIDRNGLFAGLRTSGNGYVVRYDLKLSRVSVNAWHHVAATLNGSSRELSLYLDGVRVARTTVPALSAGNTLPVSIGRSGPVSGDYWKGLIDDVRIWNVVRTPEEIATNFRKEIGSAPGLVGSWKFNEGTGPIAADSAGSPQNASLQGGATFSTGAPG